MSFKRKLNSLSQQNCPPKYCNNRQRQLNILHAVLHCECSSLNADLYKINICVDVDPELKCEALTNARLSCLQWRET